MYMRKVKVRKKGETAALKDILILVGNLKPWNIKKMTLNFTDD